MHIPDLKKFNQKNKLIGKTSKNANHITKKKKRKKNMIADDI